MPTKFAISILLLFLTFQGVSQQISVDRKLYENPSIKVDENNVPLDSSQFYFPVHFFPEFTYYDEYIDSSTVLVSEFTFPDLNDYSVIDTFRTYSQVKPNQYDTGQIKWFSEFLFALKEPLLFNTSTLSETYRFTWLRTFHHPVVIRLEKIDNEYWVYWKVGSGAGGYYPGEIKKNKKRKVKKQDWDEFMELLSILDYWNVQKKGGLPSSDGARWILEGSTPQKYKEMDAKSPKSSNPFYNVCNYLIELTRMRIREGTKY